MNLLPFLPLAAIGTAMALPAGFEIHEFAGPPNADYPAAITVAPNGDVYVSSDQNGSLGKDKGMGRIIRCRDTDGDGKADNFVHFVPDVSSPRGGHIVGDTLYLIHPPFLSSFRDTNGDGVADEKKQLLSGLGGGIEHPRGADHTTNGVRMGIDGWLYIAVGDFGTTPAKGTDGKELTLHGGGVIRVRPDGTEVEPYAVMTRNICDTAISPTLDLFSRDNTNDGKGWNTRFHHHTALGDHGYPRLYQNFAGEAIAPLADYGGCSGTGALWLNEPGFPGDFGNMLFSCDWTTGNIYYHPWKREGASFSVKQEVFGKVPRAIDIDVDGFSRLYIADWRNGGFKFSGKDKPVGMIQQVTSTATGKAQYQDVTNAKPEALITLLSSASAVQRLEAQREILKLAKPGSAVEGRLFALAEDRSKSVEARVAAIFTLKQLAGASANAKIGTLVSDAAIREFALRAVADRRSQLEGASSEMFTKMLADPDPRVVLQALIGLERIGDARTSGLIIASSPRWQTEEGASPRLMHTAVRVLSTLADVPALLKGASEPKTRTLCLRALERIHRDDVVNGLTAWIESTPDIDARLEGLGALARLYHQEKPWDHKSWWNTRPDDRGPYYETVEWQATPTIRAALEKAFAKIPESRQAAYIDLLTRNRIPVPSLKLAGLDPVVAAIGAASPTGAQLDLLTAVALDPKKPAGRRIECYKSLFRAPAKEITAARLKVLAGWLENEGSAPKDAPQHIDDFVNEPARGRELAQLRALAVKEGDAAAAIAWKAILTVKNSPLAKEPWKKQATALIGENPREVGFFRAIQALGLKGFDQQIEVALGSDNRELIAAAKAAQESAQASGGSGKKVMELPITEVTQAAMTSHGDVAEGRRLYTAQGCIACHSIDLAAEQKGPYLGAAGAKFTRDYLIESILDPNKVVAQGFQTTMLTMKDGSVQLGFVTSEEDGMVEIRNIAGQATKVKRADIAKETHMPQSMMPPGLAGTLTVGQFTSLIDYLASLTNKGG